MEVYPNRDSVSYKSVYGIPEAITMYRGTFRHKGWCETLDIIKSIDMLDDTLKDYSGFTYADFTASMAGIKGPLTRRTLAQKLNISPSGAAMDSFEWLGLFDDIMMGYGVTSPFEITSDLMISKMSLGRDERDMVALQHIFVAKWPDGKREKITSSMLDFGTPATNTAIARTVALPAAIAVKLILDGRINVSGVHRPVIPEIYEPVLAGLAAHGIVMKEEYGMSV
jgi:saccharopine dehydrogenase-like NADP-dependent oxidoreductase